MAASAITAHPLDWASGFIRAHILALVTLALIMVAVIILKRMIRAQIIRRRGERHHPLHAEHPDDVGLRIIRDAPAERAEPTVELVAEGRREVTRFARTMWWVLVATAAGYAMYFSGWGMWHTIRDKFGVTDPAQIWSLFLLFDSSTIACAWGARIKRTMFDTGGVEGVLMWVFAVGSGLMSSADANSLVGHVLRLAAPLVAAVMFELLIRGEAWVVSGFAPTGRLAKAWRWALSMMGMAPDERSDDERAQAVYAARIANARVKLNAAADGTDAYVTLEQRYLRLVRKANVRFNYSNNPRMIEMVRTNLAVMYRAVDATSPEALADLDPWSTRRPIIRPDDRRADDRRADDADDRAADDVAHRPADDADDRRADDADDRAADDARPSAFIRTLRAVPDPPSSGRSGGQRTSGKVRRRWQDTVDLYLKYRGENPSMTDAEIAVQHLDIDPRNLREALKKARADRDYQPKLAAFGG